MPGIPKGSRGMQINLCIRCMGEMEGDICPRCGFCMGQEKPAPSALKWYTILHGRYLVGKTLGQGSFDITYIGFDLPLNTRVVVKEYFPWEHASRDPAGSNDVRWDFSKAGQEGREAGCGHFLEEARRMAKIGPLPEVARAWDAFAENNTAYLVMDYVDGVTLKNAVSGKGPMKVKECLDMMAPLAKALERMHKKGMVHRDINPNNIMVLPDGDVRLLDFGVAKGFSLRAGEEPRLVAARAFSPAKQYGESGNIGPWTDVYALSATLYFALTGNRPPNPIKGRMQDVLGEKPDNNTGLTENVLSVLKAGMALEPEQRIQTVEELFSRLRKASGRKVLGNGAGKKLAVAVLPAASLLVALAIGAAFWNPAATTWTKGGVTYTGMKAAGKIEGGGRAVYEDGRIYIGDFRKGVKEGEGTCQWPNGRRYEGSWLDDKMDGTGTMTWKNGDKYEGGFKNGNMEGEGVLSYARGDALGREKYKGGWLMDKKSGYGVMVWTNGVKYEGEYKDGSKEGDGIMVWPNGQKYEGQYKNDVREGKGTFYYAKDDENNREKYEGEWLKDKRQGTGVMLWKTGAKYEGEYHHDVMEGDGRMTWPNGETYRGQFIDGKYEGTGVMTWPDGGRYEGEFRDGKRDGVGTYYFPGDNKNGYVKYEGFWKDGSYTGCQGVFYFKDGSSRIWEGNGLHR